jgi:CzcA family heavy metal efflux pump
MMRWIVGASLRFRLLVVAVAVALMAIGVTQLHDMRVDVLPEFGPTTVEVQTEALGLSAAEIEQLVTVPMEQDLLNGVAFLKDIRSESVSGLSRILLVFEPGTDVFQARQVVAERLTQAHALPNVSKPPQMLQPRSSTNRVMMIGVSSKGVSPIEMSVLARWTIVPRLAGLAGVANVSIWGQRDRQLQVQVDPEQLRDLDVSLLQVIHTAGNALWVSPLTFLEASTPGTGGLIDTPNQRLGIQHISSIVTAADLAKVTLEDSDKKLRLGDVAKVTEDHQPLIGDALTNSGPGLLFVVEKFPNASTLDVTRQVEAAIDEMRPGLSGVEFDTTVYRPASYIEKSIDNLTLALIIGALLVALVLGAFFFRWRTALISIVVIPMSLIAAVLVLWALGTTMNAIILVGLVAALGLVIDDAIIGVENVARRLRETRSETNGPSTSAVILQATLEARGPAVYATLIIALAVVPMFFMNGLAGAFLPDVAGAFLLALLASMVVAFTLTPALSILLLPQASGDDKSPLTRWLRRGYEGALARMIHRPFGVYVAAGAVLVAAVAAIPFLSTALLPTLKEEQLLIRWDGPPGTSLPEMNRITGLASRELRTVPGVREVGAHVGRAVTSDQAVGANSAELWVSIDPSADYDATAASIREVVDGYPGLTRNIETFSNKRAAEVLTSTDKDVVIRVYGEELDVLQSQAEKVKQTIQGVDGVSSASIELPAEEPTLEVEVDLEAAQRFGIKPGDVRRASAVLLSGVVVGSLFEEQKVFDVVVWGTPDTRSNLTSIRNLLIDTPDGGHVRLGQVADVRIAPDPAVIKRQAVSRYLDVGLNVGGRDRGAVVSDVERRLDEIRYPLEYHAEVLAVDGQPTSKLIGLAIAAAVVIFLMLQAFLGSWRLATLSLLTFPVALAGGVLAALATGGELSFGSLIGLVAVFGIALRNGLSLIDRFRHLDLHEGEAFGSSLVLRGASERLAPILMTAFATALVISPLVVRGGIVGYELVQPMAVVVLGGLITSTLLNLFVVPTLYLQFGSSVVRAPETAAEHDLMADRTSRADVPVPAGAAHQQTVVPDAGT